MNPNLSIWIHSIVLDYLLIEVYYCWQALPAHFVQGAKPKAVASVKRPHLPVAAGQDNVKEIHSMDSEGGVDVSVGYVSMSVMYRCMYR